jgi:beta-N-acetylhexosaminidase
MITRLLLIFLSVFSLSNSFAQNNNVAAQNWADSVYKTLSNDERITQLMVVRLSSIDTKTKTITFFDDKVKSLVKKYNIGSVCIFQGGPVKQAVIMNELQRMAKTPIMMSMDAEWGVGMRLTDSVLPLPKQMMLGAMKDQTIVYKFGQVVAEQCKRMGIQVNYAPVVDVNNNPNNPVINDRSFGEDKYKVAAYGIQYMKGMQESGVMACAKHFPGHGDVSVDSHLDLPVINKSMAQLDSLELYPFRQIFAAGISSVMLGHLYIPAIDNTPNRATSLSPKNINGLMRTTLGYQGLTFTDALEMQGVKKFFPNGEAAVQSLIAGNDMLCLVDDVPLALSKIKAAIKKKKLSYQDIELHCKKVLVAKYLYGLAALKPINTENLTADLNKDVPAMRRLVAENAITLAAKSDSVFFPLRDTKPGNVAFIGFGITGENELVKRVKADYSAAVFYFGPDQKYDDTLLKKLATYKKVVIGVHGLARTPATNFGLTKDMISMINAVQQRTKSITFLFGNAYAIKNMCTARNLVVCYEDDAVVQGTAADLLQGKIFYKGVLPVTACENLKYGTGIETKADSALFEKNLGSGFNNEKLLQIDSIAEDAIARRATPGCVVLALKDGEIAYEKAFGHLTYEDKEPVTLNTVYDLASITKVAATTISVMKLYEQGRLDLKKKLSQYLPETTGTNKENILIENLLLHQAGLVAFVPFYKETIDAYGKPLPSVYSTTPNDSFNVYVAQDLYMKNAWRDTIYKRILESKVTAAGKYLYSDNDYIFLAKVVERISGQSIDAFATDSFYTPMQLHSIGFDPLQRNNISNIAPEEHEMVFRNRIIRGSVHDPGAAMLGGVAGHAGLFSDAYDLAAVMQLLLNGGTFHGHRYLQKETVDLFTAYHSKVSRRGYGFDKPEKDNEKRKEPYPSLCASPLTFGHTGFTGTCAWADPAAGLVYVFLSNRLYPDADELLYKMNVRGKILDALYAAEIPVATGN